MSRISRYQESMARFMRNKSCVNDLDPKVRDNILEMIADIDHVASILLLTILNNQGKKNNVTLHGYYMASGIEVLLIIATLRDREKYYVTKFGVDGVRKIISDLSAQVNICLSQNIESVQTHHTKDKTVKIFHSCLRAINRRVPRLLDETPLELDEPIRRSDIVKYHFTDQAQMKDKLKGLRQVKAPSLTAFVEDKYGTVSRLALVTGWLLGGGDEKLVPSLERLGTSFSWIIKLANDFVNLEADLGSGDPGSYLRNYIINFGFQNAFEVFLDNKQKFIEGCILMDIYTNTVKEIIDLVEAKIDQIIEKSSPDMKSQYTLEE